ncbi:hypothetical protein LMG32289_02476 [Cupriavidus pampae]|uniref:Autotransporter domain-containing protein n=2 Tax=Cupriavidus pampae TaxID=659251 RepID=A0ABN7YE82_9BURK|nr:hypothetical protein LMG32289_02476 [Cupriavidus pampae]
MASTTTKIIHRLCRGALLALSMPATIGEAATIAVTDGSTQTVNGGTFEGTLTDPALLAANPGSTLVADAISAGSLGAITGVANANGVIRLANSTVQGNGAYVLQAINQGRVEAVNVSVNALAPNGGGVYADNGAFASVSGDIKTNGGYGLISATSSVILSSANILTRGDQAFGAYATGANSRIQLLGGTITTFGFRSHGVLATGPGDRVDGTATIQTNGLTAIGALAEFSGTVSLVNSHIETSGTQGNGVMAVGAGGTLTLADSAVVTSGNGADGAVVLSSGALSILRSSLRATGPDAAALRLLNGGVAELHDTTLESTQGSSIVADGGTATVSLYRSVATTNNGTWLEVRSLDPAAPTVANVVIDSSTLQGAARTDSAGTANVTLRNAQWTMTGDSVVTSLTNDASTIQFAPTPGGFRTLQTTSYIGNNGVLAMNTYMGADGSPSDRLLILGGSATGSSLLRIANAGGPGSVTAGDGILVIATANGGTTAPGAFALGAAAVGGPYEYTLQRGSIDGTAPDNWYLRSSLSCTGANAPTPPCPPPPAPPTPPTPPTPPLPHYRPEVSLYAAIPAAALQFGRTLIDSFHERAGEQTMLAGRTDLAPRAGPTGAWGRLIGMRGSRDGAPGGIYSNGPSYDYSFTGGQIGMDLWRRASATGHQDTAGAYAAIGRASVDVSHFDRSAAGNDQLDGYTLGGYWTHYGPGGWYADGVLQYTWYDVHANGNRGLPEMSTSGFAVATAAEAGYPLRVATDWVIEPQTQMVYQWVNLHDATDAGGRIGFSDAQSLAGRLGVRLARTWTRGSATVPREVTAWARVSAWHEFLGDPKTSFSSALGSIPFRADTAGSWGEVKLGITGEVARNAFVFASVGYQRGFDGTREAWDGKIGVRVNW